MGFWIQVTDMCAHEYTDDTTDYTPAGSLNRALVIAAQQIGPLVSPAVTYVISGQVVRLEMWPRLRPRVPDGNGVRISETVIHNPADAARVAMIVLQQVEAQMDSGDEEVLRCAYQTRWTSELIIRKAGGEKLKW